MKRLRSKVVVNLLLMTAGLLAASLQAQVAVPSTFVVPKSWGDSTKPGFIWNVSEVAASEPNLLTWAEQQLAGLKGLNLADPAAAGEAAAGPASAPNPATAPIQFIVPGTINFSKVDQDTTHKHPGLPPEIRMPGLPGITGSTDNIAAEALAWLELPAGMNTMGVRSDDGFRVTIGGAIPGDKYSSQAVTFGQYDPGRGAADTTFSFVISKAGIYAARLLYENGSGDANVEWYRVQGTNAVLINDTTNGGIKAYQAITDEAGAYASSVVPVPGATGVSPQPDLAVQLVDGMEPIDGQSITLTFDGARVTPQVNRQGDTTTLVTYVPSNLLTSLSTHTAVLGYADRGDPRTLKWSFTIAGYPTLDPSTAVTPDTSQPGFLFNIFANSGNQQGDNDSFDITEQGLNGLLVDSTSAAVLPNLATLTAVGAAVSPAPALAVANAPASFQVAGALNILSSNVPGLPAKDGSIDGVKAEVLTHVQLPAGVTTFVLATDGVFRSFVGSWDYLKSQQAGAINSPSSAPTSFYVFASKAGVYPLRLTWDHLTGPPALALYTVNSSGKNVLVNDTPNGGLPAYRALAAPGGPYANMPARGRCCVKSTCPVPRSSCA